VGSLPYLSSYKNVNKFFDGLASARTPDAVTQKFLQDTLGLRSTGDRPLIPLLRNLGFIDGAGKPTASYNSLKNASRARAAMAAGIRTAYGPLFDANENADKLGQEDLKGLVAQVAGSDKVMTSKIVGTLNALLKRADFADATEPEPEGVPRAPRKPAEPETPPVTPPSLGKAGAMSQAPEFHYNIQVHLPANATEDVYVSIFAAIRKVFS
jgi:hypothetical protein